MEFELFEVLPPALCVIVAIYMFVKCESNEDFASKFWHMVLGIIFTLITICMLKCTNDTKHKFNYNDSETVEYNYLDEYR